MNVILLSKFIFAYFLQNIFLSCTKNNLRIFLKNKSFLN